MDAPAFYDEQKMELYINPACTDTEAFSAIAAEVAHSRFHNKGFNKFYNRAECNIDAQSVAYLLCRRFSVGCDLPDLSVLAEAYSGWSPQEVQEDRRLHRAGSRSAAAYPQCISETEFVYPVMAILPGCVRRQDEKQHFTQRTKR